MSTEKIEDQEVQQEVQQEEAAVSLVQTVDLRYPFDFEQRKITQVTLDLSALAGDAMRRAEHRYVRGGGNPGIMEVSLEYCACCAAEISGLPYEAMDKLLGPDRMEVSLLVQNFLLGTLSRIAR